MNETRGEIEAMIYFVQGTITKNIKIGYVSAGRTPYSDSYSRDRVIARIRGIQSSDPLVCLRVIEGSRQEERLMHLKFYHAWSHGEWFKPVPELLEYVNGLPINDYANKELTITNHTLDNCDPDELLPEVTEGREIRHLGKWMLAIIDTATDRVVSIEQRRRLRPKNERV